MIYLENDQADRLYYGVSWDITATSPDCTRTGSAYLHNLLPVHQRMRTALLNADGTVNYYLNPTDWTLQEDGTASDLSGGDGEVMTRLPDAYWQFVTAGNLREVRVSLEQFTGSTFIEGQWVSSFEGVLDRTNSIMRSIINTDAQYRGGNNTSAWDAAVNSLLGMPFSNVSRTNMRTYARARGTGWEMYNYKAHKLMWWLFVTEYATRNSQKAVNTALDANGYKQGGLGNGVSTADGTEWNNFNSYNPFIPCGASNTLADGSGEVSVTITDFGGAGTDRTFKVPRYRGIENPFGHIWKNVDGINIKIQADGDGGETQTWIADDPADWNDSNYTNYTNVGLLPRANGYMSQALFGSGGEFLPSVASGGSATYFCDYWYTSLPASGESLRTLLVGGAANYGAYAGFVLSNSNYAPSSANAAFGSRLCFMGA
jgi:hypothetical protein